MTLLSVGFWDDGMVSAKCPHQGCAKYATHVSAGFWPGYYMSHDLGGYTANAAAVSDQSHAWTVPRPTEAATS